MKVKIKRDLKEGWTNGSYISDDFKAGEVLEVFEGETFGAISNKSIAVTRGAQFLEVPVDAVEEVI